MSNSKKVVLSGKRPKVSIVSVSYNQDAYIAQALDSLLQQRVNFEYEIIISDDASSDSTPKIITEYAQKYPEIIRPILRQANVGPAINVIETLRSAKGDYIAICEGDDYWTDNYKLQKQVDFMEENRNYALSFHPVKVFFENNEEPAYISPDVQRKDAKQIFTIQDLLKQNFIYTNSVMYRRQKYDHIREDVMPLDWYLHLYHAQFGTIGFLDEAMSAYRRHAGSLWWDSYKDNDKIWRKFGANHLAIYVELLKMFDKNKEYKTIIHEGRDRAYTSILEVEAKYHEGIMAKIMELFPQLTEDYMQSQGVIVRSQAIEIGELNLKLTQMAQSEVLVVHELSRIKSSWLWRAHDKLASVKRKKRNFSKKDNG